MIAPVQYCDVVSCASRQQNTRYVFDFSGNLNSQQKLQQPLNFGQEDLCTKKSSKDIMTKLMRNMHKEQVMQ